MIEVVSVSLGSRRRDRSVIVQLGGEPLRIRRFGCDGDYRLAEDLLRRWDGRVGAIGLGGLNFAYRLGSRQWAMPGATRLRRTVLRTPLVDGSHFKDAVEPQVAKALTGPGSALVVSMLDRPAAAKALHQAGYSVRAGDAHFALGLPIWPTPAAFSAMAGAAMPVLRHLPRSTVYGQRSAEAQPSAARWDVIWGDVQLVRRRPVPLQGATFVSGSLRAEDADWLRRMGLSRVIAPSPPIGGEVLGANVWEAVLAALHGTALEGPRLLDAWRTAAGQQGWFIVV